MKKVGGNCPGRKIRLEKVYNVKLDKEKPQKMVCSRLHEDAIIGFVKQSTSDGYPVEWICSRHCQKEGSLIGSCWKEDGSSIILDKPTLVTCIERKYWENILKRENLFDDKLKGDYGK